jgi:hypothetical protein
MVNWTNFSDSAKVLGDTSGPNSGAVPNAGGVPGAVWGAAARVAVFLELPRQVPMKAARPAGALMRKSLRVLLLMVCSDCPVD